MDIRVSVRNLVEFILREGDLDNRRSGAAANAMLEGSRIHRKIQKKMGPLYEAEVPLKYTYRASDYDLIIEGRADGIFEEEGVITIDEIKGTYRDLVKIKEPIGIHLAQAKCYAYMYGVQKNLDEIKVRMTYCNLDTEEIRYFHFHYSFEEIEDWFMEVLMQYQKWADYRIEWHGMRQASIKRLAFPFPYREGQKQLVTYVYQTIVHKRKLFIEAPTGVGKTISTVFPAIKAMGEGKAEMLFYLTAKTITRTVAENTFQLLREHGLSMKSITITAKEKICPLEEAVCNPEACPYAKGHFDRVNDALYDCITHEPYFDRGTIEQYAEKYQVCPFEMSLDLSLYADAVICDYNYVFDPHVYLKRFFGESVTGDYLFLVDEAHNLVDRGREMYSAVLKKEDFLTLKRLVKNVSPKMEKQLESCNKALLAMKRECDGVEELVSIAPFLNLLTRLHATMEQYLEDHVEGEAHDEILDFFFEVSHFLEINDRVDETYVMYTELDEQEDFSLHLFCVDPSKNLQECLERSISTIFFSATLLPIQYYKKLLGGTEKDYEVYAASTFDEEKRKILITNDVTSKYSRRSEQEFYKIASVIQNIVAGKQGNYMVFCPSYAFMEKVADVYETHFGNEKVEMIVQSNHMNEQDREDFLAYFSRTKELDFSSLISMEVETEVVDNQMENDDKQKSLIGFCVLGGIFGEGIDLKNDQLIGVIIVGTGLPQVCHERDIIMHYFDDDGENGFDYAYRYPGMNKVLQAAGRVIRTTEDEGVIVLLDERFLQGEYQRLFPREWNQYAICNHKNIEEEVNKFWAKR